MRIKTYYMEICSNLLCNNTVPLENGKPVSKQKTSFEVVLADGLAHHRLSMRNNRLLAGL